MTSSVHLLEAVSKVAWNRAGAFHGDANRPGYSMNVLEIVEHGIHHDIDHMGQIDELKSP